MAHARRRASGGRRRRTSRINEISANNGEVNDEELVFEDIDNGKSGADVKARLSTELLPVSNSNGQPVKGPKSKWAQINQGKIAKAANYQANLQNPRVQRDRDFLAW